MADGRLVSSASPESQLADAACSNSDLPLLRKARGGHNGFEVVDVSEWLRGVDAGDGAMDSCHFNAEGHRIVGEHLAEYLLANELR